MTSRKPSKLDVALFLLARPAYFPDLWRRVRLNVGKALLPPAMGRNGEVATRWAKSMAVDTDQVDFLARQSRRTLVTDFPAEMAAAQEMEERFPTQKGWGGSADLIYAVCESIEAATVVETGVAHGFSTLAMLLSVTKRGGHVYSVDMPAMALEDSNEVGIVVPQRLREHWTLFPFPDSVGLAKALGEIDQIDFCHYDSDKSYEGRCVAYPLLWNRLRPGGIFMSDDIADNTAFRDFCEELGLSPIVLKSAGAGSSDDRYVGLLRKP
jgi:predicted O-methyltransferase YrrM